MIKKSENHLQYNKTTQQYKTKVLNSQKKKAKIRNKNKTLNTSLPEARSHLQRKRKKIWLNEL